MKNIRPVVAKTVTSTADTVARCAKAVVGFVAPGVVALVAATQESSPGHESITQGEWIGIGAACVLTAAGVYLTPNKRASGSSDTEAGL